MMSIRYIEHRLGASIALTTASEPYLVVRSFIPKAEFKLIYFAWNNSQPLPCALSTERRVRIHRQHREKIKDMLPLHFRYSSPYRLEEYTRFTMGSFPDYPSFNPSHTKQCSAYFLQQVSWCCRFDARKRTSRKAAYLEPALVHQRILY